MIRQIILTEDGSHTIFVPEMGEHYHSVHGAIQESLHIFIKNGYKKYDNNSISILEVGFGTGLNAFLTLLESNSDKKSVYYESWEAFPLSGEESGILNYPELLNTGAEYFKAIHQADWEISIPLTNQFMLKKVHGDIRNFNAECKFDLVYFDAFGPDFQPELWESGIFKKIYRVMNENARLVTYSAKGQVRRNLREAGFLVEKAPGPPGKREITIAIKY
jgi:tRNA U34 5-methylaminomethyl-2-thiouridine-forming methyltransferase MnmC